MGTSGQGWGGGQGWGLWADSGQDHWGQGGDARLEGRQLGLWFLFQGPPSTPGDPGGRGRGQVGP